MTTLVTTPSKPYTSLHVKHFPTEVFTSRSGLEIHPMWSGEGNLSYLIVNPENRQAVLIDPDLEILGPYLLTLDMQQLELTAVIDTHNHAEHATAAPVLRQLFKVGYLMNHHAPSSFVSDSLKDDDARIMGGISAKFMYAPGHTPDLQVIVIDHHLFTGDSLLITSSGRPDLPGGDAGKQFESLQRLMQLPDETVVHPGHDYHNQLYTTIGKARQENKRVQMEREEFIRFNREFYADDDKPDDLEYYVAFNAR